MLRIGLVDYLIMNKQLYSTKAPIVVHRASAPCITRSIATQSVAIVLEEKQNIFYLHAWHQASDAHATICNLKNQELCHQLAEKTGTCRKGKINMEGCIITPSVALFMQQDTVRWAKETADEAKKKSKIDTVQLRECQCVLAAGTKVFANPLSSYSNLQSQG